MKKPREESQILEVWSVVLGDNVAVSCRLALRLGDRPERVAEGGERYAYRLPRTHAFVRRCMLSYFVGFQNGETRCVVRNVP